MFPNMKKTLLLLVAFMYVKMVGPGVGVMVPFQNLDDMCDAWAKDNKSGYTIFVDRHDDPHKIHCKMAEGDSKLFGRWTYEMD